MLWSHSRGILESYNRQGSSLLAAQDRAAMAISSTRVGLGVCQEQLPTYRLPKHTTQKAMSLKLGILKHSAHVGHRRSVPGTDWLVEGFGMLKHVEHVGHRRSVPGTDGLVEVFGTEELFLTLHADEGPQSCVRHVKSKRFTLGC